MNNSAECFVCMEVAPRQELLRTCRCDVLVHPECFQKLITRVDAHSTRCPICTEEYVMDTVGHTFRVGCSGHATILVCSYGCITGLACFAVSALTSPSSLLQMMLLCYTVIFVSAVFACLAGPSFTRTLGRLCTVEKLPIRIPRVLASSPYGIRRLFVSVHGDEISVIRGVRTRVETDVELSV